MKKSKMVKELTEYLYALEQVNLSNKLKSNLVIDFLVEQGMKPPVDYKTDKLEWEKESE